MQPEPPINTLINDLLIGSERTDPVYLIRNHQTPDPSAS